MSDIHLYFVSIKTPRHRPHRVHVMPLGRRYLSHGDLPSLRHLFLQ